MADAKGKKETEQAAAPDAKQAKRLGIRLQPVDNSDQPVLSNYTSLNVSPGIAYIDFGFLEPGMGYDALANLHQQLGRVLAGLREAAAKKNA